MELFSQHLSDLISGFLRDDHFMNTVPQRERAVAKFRHLSLRRDVPVTRHHVIVDDVIHSSGKVKKKDFAFAGQLHGRLGAVRSAVAGLQRHAVGLHIPAGNLQPCVPAGFDLVFQNLMII